MITETKILKANRNQCIEEALRTMVTDLHGITPSIIIEDGEDSSVISITMLDPEALPEERINQPQEKLNALLEELASIDPDVCQVEAECDNTTRKLTASAGELLEPLHICLSQNLFSMNAHDEAERVLVEARGWQDRLSMASTRRSKKAPPQP